MSHKSLSPEQTKELLATLKSRFEDYPGRHKGVEWSSVQSKLELNQDKLWSLFEMERTGGEPDVVGVDFESAEYIFFDCSKETPAGRRSLCFDQDAWESRKQAKPKSSATQEAENMGIEILDEEQYQYLQTLGHFDLKTSSWIKTPDKIRNLGGALFGDYRFGRVFIYHNGAESYYAARGFRGVLRV